MNKLLHQENMHVVWQLVEKRRRENKICLAILGGSVARGDETEHSDVDINFYAIKKNLPEEKTRFYRFRNKYIEESFFDINYFDSDELLDEQVVLFDSGKYVRKRAKRNKFLARAEFRKEVLSAQEKLDESQNNFDESDYERSLQCLLGTKSSNFILVHALPRYYGLPYPSFRLFDSIKKIDLAMFDYFKAIYELKKGHNFVLEIFGKAYRKFGEKKRKENSGLSNYGFYDALKIKYNLEGLKETYKKYPRFYADRFIVGCIVSWAAEDVGFRKYLVEIFGKDFASKENVLKKLEFSKKVFLIAKRICN